ncbi:mtDNA inheritance protein Dml1 [Mycena olivaceomarginata]|nr:mtDNA inheritance protein Dml1 [Mycena olivaceomarginata]
MKEILYIQAGEQANYIGTHFWNTQESYFTYEDGEDSETDHGISFREGLNQKREPTFCPRLLAFDHKAHFGTLSQANALFGMDDAADGQALWSGNAVEYKQEPVSKSHYQIDMEELDTGYTSSAVQRQDIRYWSDLIACSMSRDTGLTEGAFRLFLEECETIQGIQLMHDTSTFGSFVDAFLTSVRDDFAKLPLFSWSLLSDATPFKPMDNKRGVRKLVNDALTMRSLSEMSSISVPIQSPTTWTDEVCSNTHIQADHMHIIPLQSCPPTLRRQHCLCGTRTLFQLSAKEDILSFSARLGWRTAVPFAELRGVFPYVDAVDLERRIYNFSSCTPTPTSATQFSRYDVTRGFPSSGIAAYNQRLSGFGFEASVVSRYGRPFVSVPFHHGSAALTQRRIPFRHHSLLSSVPPRPPSPKAGRLESCPGPVRRSSSLRLGRVGRRISTPATRGSSTRAYAGKFSVETTGGIDLDEMSDLANDLWTLHDTAGGEPDPTSDSDGRGEDEE